MKPIHRDVLVVESDARRLLDRLRASPAAYVPKWLDKVVGEK